MEPPKIGRGRGQFLRSFLSADSDIKISRGPNSLPSNEPLPEPVSRRANIQFSDLQFSTDDDEPVLETKYNKLSLGDEVGKTSSSSLDSHSMRQSSPHFSDSEPESLSSYEHFKKNNCTGFKTDRISREFQNKTLSPSKDSPVNESESHKTNKINLQSDFTIGHIVQRMEKACGIIHGDIDCENMSTISDLKLDSTISSILASKKITELTRSQMYEIPILLQRRNLIFVGPPLTGKTFGCVLPMMSLILDNERYLKLDDGNGPRCVFLTSNSHKVKVVGDLCTILAGHAAKIVTAHGGGLEMERAVPLTNGCDVLVTTPRCWLRLLQHPTVTNLNRLCHIAFDDSDVLLNTFKAEIKIILRCLHQLLDRRKEKMCDYGVHVAIIGEKWTPSHDECLKIVKSPVVSITSHLEAALYSKISPITRIISSGGKIKKLKELLAQSDKYPTVVMCRSVDEVKELEPHLSEWDKKLIVAHESMGFAAITGICSKWEESGDPNILLCSDAVIGELAITNAQNLIHYSLPESKSFFSERFSTLQSNFIDKVKNPEHSPPECWVNILLDNQNVLQFPEIIKFLERLDFPIPQNVKDVLKTIETQKEEEKSDCEFCNEILMFEKCHNVKKCRYRHILMKEMDGPIDLPSTGLVKMKMLYIHNPSHYSVRVIAVKPTEEDKWQERKSNFGKIALKMANYYSKRNKRIPHGKVFVGDLVCVEVEMDILFKRGIVVEILKKDDKQMPTDVLVKLIDEGSFKKCKAFHLLYLSPEFHEFDPEAQDVFLPGILPVDFDPEWSSTAVVKLRSAFSKAVEKIEDFFFIGKIALTIGNKMIVSSFLCYEWLETNKCYRVLFSPRRFILDVRLADLNEDHLPKLLALAKEANLIPEVPGIPEKSEIPIKTEITIEPVIPTKPEIPIVPENPTKPVSCKTRIVEDISWAQLEIGDFVSGYISFFESPSLFFLRTQKNKNRLAKLEENLNKSLNNNFLRPEKIVEDMACAVKNPEWNRGMVLGVEADEVDILCVDYGDVISVPFDQVSLLPEGFVSLLPFQAIECGLVGVVPQESDWSQESVDFFNSLITNDKGEMKELVVTACEVGKSKSTENNNYKVLLIDKTDSGNIVVNKELLMNAFANWATDGSKSHILNLKKDTDFSVKQEESDDEEEYDAGSISGDDSDTDSSPGNANEVWTDENALDKSRVGKTWQILKEDEEKKNNDQDFKNILELIQKGDFDMEYSSEFTNNVMDILPTSVQKALKGVDPPQLAIENPSQVTETEVGPDALAEKEAVDSIKDETTDRASDTNVEDPDETKSKEYEIEELEGNKDKFLLRDDSLILFEHAIAEAIGKKLEVYRPMVLWTQNDYKLKISIQLPDVLDYLTYRCHQHVIFKCLIVEKVYAFEFKLFGPVKKDKTQFIPLGQRFDMKFDKVVPGPWPRLVYERNTPSYIKFDSSSLVDTEVDVIETFMERALRNKETPEEYQLRMERRAQDSLDPHLRVPDIYSDVESSESDVPSDVEQYDNL